jgi:branched-chain amino acid transport system substrate-binding protein
MATMTTRKFVLIILFIIGLIAVVGLGIDPINKNLSDSIDPKPEQVVDRIPTKSPPLNSSDTKNSNTEQARISLGDSILFKYENNNQLIQDGARAFGDYNFKLAEKQFKLALRIEKNNPEIKIYLENAKAMSKPIIKIAAVVPISSYPNEAKEILRGLAQVQHEVNNKGGVDKKLLQIYIVDDNQKTAKEVAEKFVKDSQLMAVIGHSFKESLLAAAEVYKGKIAIISPLKISERELPYGGVFSLTPNPRAIADALVKHIKSLPPETRKVAICYDPENFESTLFKDQFIRSLFAENQSEYIDIGCSFGSNFNPSDAIDQAIQQKVRTLVLSSSLESRDQAIQIKHKNSDRLLLLGNSALYAPEVLVNEGGKPEKLIVAVVWDEAIARREFIELAREIYGTSAVSWRTALVYDALKSITQAIDLGINRENIQKKITVKDFLTEGSSTKEPVSFNPSSGDRDMKAFLVESKNDKFEPLTLDQNQTEKPQIK